MQELTLHLFERMGMLLILTFILTRIPLFRQLLDRKEMSGTRMFIYSCLFGLFGILGVYAGVVVENERIELLLLADAADGGAGSGPFRPGRRCHWRADRRAPRWHRGGLLAGAHLLYIGGYTGLAGAIAVPLTGALAGAWPDSSRRSG